MPNTLLKSLFTQFVAKLILIFYFIGSQKEQLIDLVSLYPLKMVWRFFNPFVMIIAGNQEKRSSKIDR